MKKEQRSPAEEEANAFLIAAAPEMYVTLNEIHNWMRWLEDNKPALLPENDIVIQIGYALAKAEGNA